MYGVEHYERGNSFLPAGLWAAPPDELVLPDDEVHVWRAWLDCPASLSMLATLLSGSEIARANRFHFSRDRDRFIIAHSVLRLLLGQYLREDPKKLRFITNEFRKPFLAWKKTGEPLCFNLSHSGAVALFAFVRGRNVGIDVEHIRPDFFEPAIARRFFAPEEVADLEALDPLLQVTGFFNCWTRKEAYIKARGLGLSLPLSTFRVSLRPGSGAALLCYATDPTEMSRWSLQELAPGEGYVGSLAVEGHNWKLRSWQWRPEPSLVGA